MPNRVNQLLLKDYVSRFDGVSNVVSVGYAGLPVKVQGELRDKLAELDIKLTFVKNRLVNIAFKELGLPEVLDICNGQTAFAYGEDPVAIARFMADFAKANEGFLIHGGMVESTILDTAGVISLSKSPTKEELKSQIVGQILSAGANVAGALKGPASTIAGQIKARVEELEKQSA